jgi:hypothetical protein
MAWREWKSHPQTKAFLALLQQSVQDHQQAWLNNELMADTVEKTALLNAGALGSAQAIEQIVGAIENIDHASAGEVL